MPNGKKKYVRISVKKFEGQTQAFKMARDPKQACLCFLMNPKMGFFSNKFQKTIIKVLSFLLLFLCLLLLF
jgi:hypothetical protein